MRQFQFTKGEIQAFVKCDIIDPATQLFTIMEIRGGKGNEFESIFPWHQGSTLFLGELKQWFAKYSAAWTGIEYGGSEVIQMNDSSLAKTLTITPSITGDTKATVKIKVKNSDEYVVDEKTVELTDSTDSEVDIQIGFKYEFELVSGESWTSGAAPDAIVCDGDETASLGITVS